MMRKEKNPESGFILAALIFFLTATSIIIAAAVPYYQMQAKRTIEDELIFRGGEYTRAIQKYQHKTGKYPLTLDALMDTNGVKFLRRQYTDPLTGKPFRLLYINPDGSITGSVLTQVASPFGNQQQSTSPFGSSSTSGQPGQPGQSTQPGQATQPGQTAQPGTQPSSQQQTSVGFGIGGQTSQTGGAAGMNPNGTQGPPSGTSGIVGVASDSKDTSVMVYNLRTKYNEWEFLATTQQNQQVQPGQTSQPGTNGSPSTIPGSSPFGSQPPATQPASPIKLP